MNKLELPDGFVLTYPPDVRIQVDEKVSDGRINWVITFRHSVAAPTAEPPETPTRSGSRRRADQGGQGSQGSQGGQREAT